MGLYGNISLSAESPLHPSSCSGGSCEFKTIPRLLHPRNVFGCAALSATPETHVTTPACHDIIQAVRGDVRLPSCHNSSASPVTKNRKERGGKEEVKEEVEEETRCGVWGHLKGWVTRLMSRQVAPLRKRTH